MNQLKNDQRSRRFIEFLLSYKGNAIKFAYGIPEGPLSILIQWALKQTGLLKKKN
jgi:hypothetical protein